MTPTVAAMAETPDTPGPVALVGGGEWQPGCSFDAELLAASGADEVVVLPTAAAYEHPERTVARAGEWFAPLGGRVEGLMVLSRADAQDRGRGGGAAASPLRLPERRLPHAPAQRAQGLAGLGGPAGRLGGTARWWPARRAAAMVLTDPMVDARGGA